MIKLTYRGFCVLLTVSTGVVNGHCELINRTVSLFSLHFTDMYLRMSIMILMVCSICTHGVSAVRFYCSFRITSSLKAYGSTLSLGLASKHYCVMQNHLKQVHSKHFSSVRRGKYFLHCQTVTGLSQRQVFWKANIAWKKIKRPLFSEKQEYLVLVEVTRKQYIWQSRHDQGVPILWHSRVHYCF